MTQHDNGELLPRIVIRDREDAYMLFHAVEHARTALNSFGMFDEKWRALAKAVEHELARLERESYSGK